jgi:general secretion pathway protein D
MRVKKQIVCSMVAMALASEMALAAVPSAKNPPPNNANSNPAKDDTQGFVSAKTNKSMANSHIEDITNENFPDMIESFDYPNADIADLVKAISELTGKNFIVDPNVHGKITIIAPSRITVAEAYKAFLSALAINGLAVVPGDGFYKIKQARAAQRDNIETYGGAYYPSADQMITRIVKLKYISADEINKQLRIITSNQGEVMAYTPTNSLIISDYGANIDRVMKIIAQLDVQGFEEQMEVIRIRYARAKDMAELIDQIINKGEKSSSSGGFPGGVPRFRRAGEGGGGTSGAEVYSVVVAEERTNSIIVVGNKAGIEKIRHLVSRLDFRLRPDEQGGVNVYYVRNHEAEQIANTLNNIASEAKKALDSTTQGKSPVMPQGPGGQIGPPSTAIFGGDVKIAADKISNSLIITASKQDFEVIKGILAKIDIARDQVFIKAYILEMFVDKQDTWELDYYKFSGTGAARMGFRGASSLQDLIDPTNDKGGVLGFGGGGTVTLGQQIPSVAGQTTTPTTTGIQVASIDGLLKFLAGNTQTNVISTPQIMAINNEEAMIEVGEKVPVANNQQQNGTSTISQVQRENVTTKLTITPYLSPDNDRVKMKVKQEVAGISNTQVKASELAKNAISTTTRNITTQLVIDNGDTAVLGGLMSDQDDIQEYKIPVLGDIPIIGWLFKSRNHEKKKTNLMVFLTPKIIRSPEDNSSIVNKKINERIDFIQKNMGGQDAHGQFIDEMPRRASANPVDASPTPGPEEKIQPLEPTPEGGEKAAPLEDPAVETF